MASTHDPIISANPSQILTPTASSTINKPVTIAPTPGSNLRPIIFTNREWVVPPRPKPGRKPAGDAPPTKRKAQNREAQRAFRERRAAKVGELEEQLKETEEEAKREREGLRARVEQLHDDLQHYTDLVSSWQQRYRELEMACVRERQLRQMAETEIQTLRKGIQSGTEAVALPRRRESRHEYLVVQQSVGQGQTEPCQQEDTTLEDMTCGRCNGSTRCQCIEEAFEMTDIAIEGSNDAASKRLHSPSSRTDNKRMRHHSAGIADEGNEVDFTARYASQRARNETLASTAVPIPETAHFEPCGLCRDGDVCICAALTVESQQQPSHAVPASTGTNASATNEGLSNSCTNNPGSCAQCRSNPTSTLFCKTLAATRNASDTDSSYVVPNGTSGTQALPEYPLAPLAGPTLTCADTFTTLSRHRAFSRASTELGTWVSQLTAVPGANTEGKTAFEIEAASVMSVLQFFDTRLGDERRNKGVSGKTEVKEVQDQE
ncbi:MAG: hypothetical protein Q9217_004805 [Psora testacea]